MVSPFPSTYCRGCCHLFFLRKIYLHFRPEAFRGARKSYLYDTNTYVLLIVIKSTSRYLHSTVGPVPYRRILQPS